jgi:hypothetical protein
MKSRAYMFGKRLQEQRALLFALTAVLGLVFCASLPARADTVKLTFDIPAPLAPPPGSRPWATLTLTRLRFWLLLRSIRALRGCLCLF